VTSASDRKGQARRESLEQRRDRIDAEERRRAAAEKDARDRAPGREVEIPVEVGEERGHIFRFRKALGPHVRVEIAVRGTCGTHQGRCT
jgi:hypothetical protein